MTDKTPSTIPAHRITRQVADKKEAREIVKKCDYIYVCAMGVVDVSYVKVSRTTAVQILTEDKFNGWGYRLAHGDTMFIDQIS